MDTKKYEESDSNSSMTCDTTTSKASNSRGRPSDLFCIGVILLVMNIGWMASQAFGINLNDITTMTTKFTIVTEETTQEKEQQQHLNNDDDDDDKVR